MGWFWGTEANKSTADPYQNLDKDLKQFLQNETPSNQQDGKAGGLTSTDASQTYRASLGLNQPSLESRQQSSEPTTNKPAVPAESLFQDGRYAHLWSTYRPQSEIEAANQSDQDKLTAVIETYNNRRAAIGRAALENCVELQIAEKECFTHGPWTKRLRMCSEENRAFNRCFTMQSRFLKALGYLAVPRGADEDERIQMHADRLFHEMLDRERLVAEARESGAEAPPLPPLIRPDRTMEVLGEDSAWARARRRAVEEGGGVVKLSDLPVAKQAEVRERIKDMSKEEAEVELQLMVAESRAQQEYADKIRESMEEERAGRADRRERGKETVGDTIKRLWGWQQ